MRERSGLIFSVVVTLCSATTAWSGQSDVVAQVLGALRSQGYREIWFERTLLNRVRITAERKGYDREIVVDPRTGEILRDYSARKKPRVPASLFGVMLTDTGDHGGSRSGGGDDHDSDDHDSDDDDDDDSDD